MKNIQFLLLAIVFLGGWMACQSSEPLMEEQIKTLEHSSYQTYQLLEHEDDLSYGVNQKTRQQIEKAIQRELLVSKLKMSTEPDLWISYFVKESLLEKREHNYVGYYKKWGFPLWTNVDNYAEGTLIIDVIDSKSSEIIWHGKSKAKITDRIENAEHLIQENVQTILEKFLVETGLRRENTASVR